MRLPRVIVPRVSRRRVLAVAVLATTLAVASFARAANLGTDQLLNFKVPGCNCSGAIPPNQIVPAVAAWKQYVLVTWYDFRYRCLSGVNPAQSYGYSADYGVTFKDAGLITGPPGSVFFGDPSIAVNAKTGNFYIVGYRRLTTGSVNGLLALKGHFEADTFHVDTKVVAGVADPGETYERPWVAADSVSGNVYVVWDAYDGLGNSAVEMQRYDADLNALAADQTLASVSSTTHNLQNAFDAVGPSGELYVAWSDYGPHFGPPLSEHQIVRSDDHGATFGAAHTVSTLEVNTLNDAPGSTRPYGLSDVSLAVDNSRGPHRGRVYMSWDETIHFHEAPFSDTTSIVEVEPNGTFATANTFVPGGKLRGSVVPGDKDFFRFTGQKGQTFVARVDTTTGTGIMRVICQSSSDTSSAGTYRTLGYALGDGIVVGLPYDGTYTLQLDNSSGGETGGYIYDTALMDPPGGGGARDARDQFVAYSDDGTTWSAPVRINDSDAGFDGCFPSLGVDDRGRVHCTWLDYRVSACGDLSDLFMASSGDGGATWGANRRVSDQSSYWNSLKSCTVYNHGTYQTMFASGDRVYATFPDARLGDTDVFMDASRHASLASSPAPQSVPAGTDTALPFSLSNEGSFDTPLAWTLVDDAGWLTVATPGLSGSQSLAANGATVAISATFHPPGDCANDSTIVRFITSDPFVPGYADTSVTTVRCTGTTGVPPERHELAFGIPHPTPSRRATHLSYSLSRAGVVRLELFGVNGARVRVLEAGVREAGPHEVLWDGRDDDGRLVAAGAYFARFDAEGRTMRRTVLMLR